MIDGPLTPVIVSASRSTDMSAFYADWLLARLKDGRCSWLNPFNHVKYRVSFEKTRMLVFWSKNPRPLYERLDELEALGYKNYYFQFTLNDYVREGLEPNVPSVESRIDTFRKIADRIGKARVIWRFDPLILSQKLTVEELLGRILSIGRALKGSTEKLVFSFADIQAYRKVAQNLVGTGCREFFHGEKIAFVEGLRGIGDELGLELATCAEDIDLEQYGINHNKCIDDDLMARLFSQDGELMDFLGAEYDLVEGRWLIRKSKKDKGQRKACGCVMSKDIGMYNTCPHLCKYCYANASAKCALDNWKRHRENPFRDSII